MAEVLVDNCKPAYSKRSTSLHDPVKINYDDSNKPITIPELFRKVVKDNAQHPALVYKNAEGNWISHTYQEYFRKSRTIARGFIKLGLKPRSSCGILAICSPEWFIAQMATIFVGGVYAGIYLTNSAEAVYHVLDKSGAMICVVDDATQMAKVRSVRHRLPMLTAVIQIQGPFEDFIDSEKGFYSWTHLERIGASDMTLDREVDERMKNLAANECVALIYTSGTVGMPKGVMLTHDNFISVSRTMIKEMPNAVYGHEVAVSYLPLNHVGGQLMDFYIGLTLGACVYFADRDALRSTLLQTLVKAQPTYFFGVPRVYEKMQEKVMAVEQQMSWVPKLIVNTARSILKKHHLSVEETGNKSKRTWSYSFASKAMQRTRTDLGLSRCHTNWIGAASTALETKKFFLGYDIKLLEMYGLSESTGPLSLNSEMDSLKSCGRPLPGVEVKVADPDSNGHGEICCRSRMVFMGYLNDADKTQEALSEDGWLRSGDLGYLDSKRRLYITGRLKELIVTSGGENIPPIRIELLVLKELPGLANAMLIGDRRKFLTILLTIKTGVDSVNGFPSNDLQTESLEWIKSLGLPYKTVTDILEAGPCPKVLQSIQEGLNRANKNAISRAQKVQKFAILPQDFSIAGGELGPTLKLRRDFVVKKYENIIEELYKNT